uniref:Uncharacterized protein n=1 Tax=Micromonas pusilla TaxID=38833 RepID=A0A7S0NM19_MICPS
MIGMLVLPGVRQAENTDGSTTHSEIQRRASGLIFSSFLPVIVSNTSLNNEVAFFISPGAPSYPFQKNRFVLLAFKFFASVEYQSSRYAIAPPMETKTRKKESGRL